MLEGTVRALNKGGAIKNIKLAAIAFWVVAAGFVQAAEVAGVRIATSARVGGSDLALHGAGLRQRLKTDVYIIGLYLMTPKHSAEDAIGDAGPKRIALRLMRDVTARSLVDALYEGIRDNTSVAEFARLKPAADELAAMMLPLMVAKKGDVVALDYVPDTGSQIVVNGRAAGQPVPGQDLYRALLKIWLGDTPVDQDLKRALLSGRAK
jgi:Chalcone isomerase-like